MSVTFRELFAMLEETSPLDLLPGVKNDPGKAGRIAWLPLSNTSKGILIFSSHGARKTISRYRAMVRSSTLPVADKTAEYAQDSPLPPKREPTNGVRKRERDRAERIKRTGGPKPSLREKAVALARKHGEVRTKDLTDIGVPRCYLTKMCEEGLLTRVAFGRYRVADAARGKT